MFASLKKSWTALKHSRPGHRFQDRYNAHRKTKQRQSAFKRIGLAATGVALIAIGILFLFIPGPGILFLFVGGGLLGSESLHIARFLDKNELFWRKIMSWSKRRWKKMGLIGKTFTSLAGAICAAAVGYGYYYYLFEKS